MPDEQAKTLFDTASEPKALRWYDTAHEVLDIAAIADRARFLASQLKLKPIDPILKAKSASAKFSAGFSTLSITKSSTGPLAASN